MGEIVEHYKGVHKSGLNLRFFNGEIVSYQDFNGEFRQTPMFQEKKLFILKNIFKNEAFKDLFIENGEKFINSKDIIVFLAEGKLFDAAQGRDSFFKFLIKNAKVQEFKILDGLQLRNWAQKEFDKYGAKIVPEALRQLVNYAGSDLWRLSNEIQKLASFKKGSTVGIKDINFMVRTEVETDIFKTIEAIVARNKKQALSLTHKHLEGGDNPLYLLSMINFQFRNLLLIKKTGKLAAHPYIVKKTAALARSFALKDLEKIYRDIFEADIKIKTGQLDPQLALDLLITGF